MIFIFHYEFFYIASKPYHMLIFILCYEFIYVARKLYHMLNSITEWYPQVDSSTMWNKFI